MITVPHKYSPNWLAAQLGYKLVKSRGFRHVQKDGTTIAHFPSQQHRATYNELHRFLAHEYAFKHEGKDNE